VLSKMGILKPQAKLAGASSGAVITASYCSGLGPAEIIGAGHALVSCLSAVATGRAPACPLVACGQQLKDMQQQAHKCLIPGLITRYKSIPASGTSPAAICCHATPAVLPAGTQSTLPQAPPCIQGICSSVDHAAAHLLSSPCLLPHPIALTAHRPRHAVRRTPALVPWTACYARRCRHTCPLMHG
jgi:hypothetical protein